MQEIVMKKIALAILAGSLLVTGPAYAKPSSTGGSGDTTLPDWCYQDEFYAGAYAAYLVYVAGGGTLAYNKWLNQYWRAPCR
jgi:hypothetical protein